MRGIYGAKITLVTLGRPRITRAGAVVRVGNQQMHAIDDLLSECKIVKRTFSTYPVVSQDSDAA